MNSQHRQSNQLNLASLSDLCALPKSSKIRLDDDMELDILVNRDHKPEFIALNPIKHNPVFASWQLAISVHQGNLQDTWNVFCANEYFSSLLKYDIEISDIKKLEERLERDQHYLQTKSSYSHTFIIVFENQNLNTLRIEDAKQLLQQSLLVFDMLYGSLQRLSSYLAKNKNSTSYQKYFDIYNELKAAYLGMTVENKFSYDPSILTTLKSLYDRYLKLPFEILNLSNEAKSDCTQVINHLLAIHSSKNDSERRSLYVTISECWTSTGEKNKVRTALGIDSHFQINSKVNDYEKHINGGQIIISNIPSSAKQEIMGFVRAFENDIAKSSKNYYTSKTPEYTANLSDTCSIFNLHYGLLNAGKSRNLETPEIPNFFCVPEHVDPALNPFFDEIVNYLFKKSLSQTYVPFNAATDNIPELRNKIIVNAGFSDNSKFVDLLDELKKLCDLTKDSKENLPQDYSLNFIMHALHKDPKILPNIDAAALKRFMHIDASCNPIVDFLKDGNFSANDKFSANIQNILLLASKFSSSKKPPTPAQKLLLIEEAFHYFLQNEKLGFYDVSKVVSHRSDHFRINSLFQKHLKDLKDVYLNIVRANQNDKEILEIAKRSELVNFQRTAFQFFETKKTSTLKEIEKIERKHASKRSA